MTADPERLSVHSHPHGSRWGWVEKKPRPLIAAGVFVSVAFPLMSNVENGHGDVTCLVCLNALDKAHGDLESARRRYAEAAALTAAREALAMRSVSASPFRVSLPAAP